MLGGSRGRWMPPGRLGAPEIGVWPNGGPERTKAVPTEKSTRGRVRVYRGNDSRE